MTDTVSYFLRRKTDSAGVNSLKNEINAVQNIFRLVLLEYCRMDYRIINLKLIRLTKLIISFIIPSIRYSN
ncbi:hypothetical protein D3C87_1983220 [compost metagenome]